MEEIKARMDALGLRDDAWMCDNCGHEKYYHTRNGSCDASPRTRFAPMDVAWGRLEDYEHGGEIHEGWLA